MEVMEVLAKEGVNVYGHYTFTSNNGNVFIYDYSQDESILFMAYNIYGPRVIDGTLVLKDGKNYVLTKEGCEFLYIEMEE